MNALDAFPSSQKTAAAYLDVAINEHGDEKSKLMHRAIERVNRPRPRVVEIGPGGGAAITHLAGELRRTDRSIDLTLIEAPQVTSDSLARAIADFDAGTCVLIRGLAHDIGSLLAEPVDVISASALLHEVYSYGGAYPGLRAFIRTLPAVLAPGGWFAYRDVYTVDAPSLHERVMQSYDTRAWLLFLRMFTPHYLDCGVHPYHHVDDELVAHQDSRLTPVAELDARTCAVMTGPIGLFREIQRHYLTLRDYAWRSGVLGFRPILDGHFAGDWIDLCSGHKRVHYTLTSVDWLAPSQKAMLLAMSEPYADHYAIDGDIFDEVTDIALTDFLAAAEHGDSACAATWASWLTREGCETYAYFTTEELLTSVAVQSIEARQGTVLIPSSSHDIVRAPRHYYNRFLGRRLSNPMCDAKQLVLFHNVVVSDTDTLMSALAAIRPYCGKSSLAKVHTAIHSGG